MGVTATFNTIEDNFDLIYVTLETLHLDPDFTDEDEMVTDDETAQQ